MRKFVGFLEPSKREPLNSVSRRNSHTSVTIVGRLPWPLNDTDTKNKLSLQVCLKCAEPCWYCNPRKSWISDPQYWSLHQILPKCYLEPGPEHTSTLSVSKQQPLRGIWVKNDTQKTINNKESLGKEPSWVSQTLLSPNESIYKTNKPRGPAYLGTCQQVRELWAFAERTDLSQ